MGDELLPPSFHPSILPATKIVNIFLKHANKQIGPLGPSPTVSSKPKNHDQQNNSCVHYSTSIKVNDYTSDFK